MPSPVKAGFLSGGSSLTAAQSGALALLSATGNRLDVAGSIATAPVDVSDWSSRPAGWFESPDASIAYAAGGMTFTLNDTDSYLANGAYAAAPAFLARKLTPSLETLDVSMTVDSFTNHGTLPSGFFYVAIMCFDVLLGEIGAWAGTRLFYSDGAAGTTMNPFWRMVKRHKIRGERTGAGADITLVQEAATDPGATTLRLKLDSGLNTYQSWFGETEVGGSDPGTGAVAWRTGGTDMTYDGPPMGDPYLVIEVGCSATPTSPITCRVTDLAVNEVVEG